MNISIADILQQLYSVTLTPTGENEYLNEPDVLNIMDCILKSNSLLTRYPETSDAEIQKIVDFILKLVNTPFDLQGALVVELSIKYLVIAACKDINISFGTIKKIMYIIRDWYSALKASPNAKKINSKCPEMGAFPLFRFHTDAYKDAKVNKKFPSLYRSYAYQIHKKIRKNESDKIKSGFSDETHEAYVRSARFFFKYMPTEIKSKQSHPDAISNEYIENYVRQYDIMENRNYDGLLTPAAKSYKEKFISLLQQRQINPKPHEGHTPVEGRAKRVRSGENDILKPEPVDGEIHIIQTEGPWIKEHVERLDEFDIMADEDGENNECREFEAPIEINTYVASDEVNDYIVPRKPSIRRSYEDILNLRNFHFYWDSNYLNLFHYSVLYKSFEDNWGKSLYYDSIITYLYILIHTGIDSKKMLDLKTVRSEEENNGSIALFGKENRYYILNQSPIQLKKPESNEHCLNTSESIKVPIPETAGKLISEILRHDSSYVFSYANNSNRTIRLSLMDIEKFIANEIKGKYPQYSLKISPSKISRSFIPLYHHRFGLDPIICCYISGEDYHRLYKSQMHYIHLEHSILEREYLGTYELVNAAINRNLSQCILRGFLDGDTKLASSKLFEAKKVEKEDRNISCSTKESFGYGSTIICDEEYIRSVANCLKEAILNEADAAARHNLYVIYTYLCLQFNTGLRPRNDPDIIWDDYNAEAGVVAVQDKQSAIYHEKRFLPLANIANSLLKNLKKGFHDIQKHIAIYKRPSAIREKQAKVFFLINSETGKFEKYTLKKMRECMKGIGLDYSLPMNMPRHFMRNYLYHEGISNDLADVWMGHQHSGKEILNIASCASYGKSVRECLFVIESMIDRIGFIDIPYMVR